MSTLYSDVKASAANVADRVERGVERGAEKVKAEVKAVTANLWPVPVYADIAKPTNDVRFLDTTYPL